MLLSAGREQPSFVSTAVASGGILLREGVEAALLIAALLGVAAQAGLGERKRWVHAGWITALAFGAATWMLSSRLIAVSGASRELVEGVTALLATLVLFYVSYSLLAKKEVARWMRFLRAQVSPRRAAASLFFVAFLAAYREAFETVLFYQTLLASRASTSAALAGALVGALLLVTLVLSPTDARRPVRAPAGVLPGVELPALRPRGRLRRPGRRGPAAHRDPTHPRAPRPPPCRRWACTRPWRRAWRRGRCCCSPCSPSC